MKTPNIALTIDTESNLVNMDGFKFEYVEEENKIYFEDERMPQKRVYTLDRVSGIFISHPFSNFTILDFRNYECTRTDALF
jgi:hypothetical protein